MLPLSPSGQRPEPHAALYIIGDVQGCDDALERLLAAIDVDSQADPLPPRIWLAGDLVNRGPASAAALRRVIALGQRARVVLGNHDLHLLAVAAGARSARRGDTVDEILKAPDAERLLDWVRHQPLAILEDEVLMVHAGVLPQWSAQQTVALAGEVEAGLQGPDWRGFVARLFGNEPARWDAALEGDARLRVIVNGLTRLRFCDAAGNMDFKSKGGAAAAPAGFLPWFDAPARRTANVTVVFGHWSALGVHLRDNLCALDSGCVWGRKLTAIRLAAEPAQRRLVQVECAQCQ